MFLYLEAQHPKRPKKQIVGGICDYFGVGRSYVYQVVKEIDPERKKNIEAGAAVIAKFYGPKKST